MKKKIIIVIFTLLFVLPFSSGLSCSQGNSIQPIELFNIHKPSNISLKSEKKNNDYIEMKITAYDLSVQSCGKYYFDKDRGITKDGYNLNNKSRKETMIVSSNKFPMGTKLQLIFPKSHEKYNGIYTVHDTGNFKDNILDVYLGDFGEKVNQDTVKFGRVDVKVEVIK